MSRRWLAAGAAAVVAAATLAAIGGWHLLRRDDVEPATVADAVASFRAQQASAAATGHPATPIPTGVYVYETDGFEQTDALGGATHRYPSTSTISVTGHPCGVLLRWDVLDGRSTTWQLCLGSDGWTQKVRDERHTFFGIGDQTTYRCPGTAFRPQGDKPGRNLGFTRYDKATRYTDYREMLDKQGKSIDAVTIAIPDHMHAPAALACMQLGKGVYVEKPLTRTPWEARLLTQAAQRYKVATQMGNQGYSHEATRVAAEIIWSGEIGAVTEVHAWHGRPGWPQGMTEIPPPEPVPDTLDWDLWLGGSTARPYTSGGAAYKASRNTRFGFYQPFNWRGFYDFGSGLIGDWAIHILGPANVALGLGSPVSVECVKKDV